MIYLDLNLPPSCKIRVFFKKEICSNRCNIVTKGKQFTVYFTLFNPLKNEWVDAPSQAKLVNSLLSIQLKKYVVPMGITLRKRHEDIDHNLGNSTMINNTT